MTPGSIRPHSMNASFLLILVRNIDSPVMCTTDTLGDANAFERVNAIRAILCVAKSAGRELSGACVRRFYNDVVLISKLGN